jgi:tetratricopeptide (TPR) repeat protein
MVDAPSGSLTLALQRATALLATDANLAGRQAEEILRVVPGEPRATLVLGVSHRLTGDPRRGLELLLPLAEAQPKAASVHYELGQCLAALGRNETAIDALRRATALQPDAPEAWRALADQLTLTGETRGADAAYAQHIRASVNDPVLVQAAVALCDDRLAVAERLLRDHLKRAPTDVAALRMLAELGTRLGRYGEAEAMLARCLELAPSFTGARHNYAIVLYRQQKSAEAIPHIEALLAQSPRDPAYRNLMAAALGLVGEYARAIVIYEDVLAEYPSQPKIWMAYGHALRTAGRRRDAVEAYQRAIALAPHLGEAYWSLANLKTERFTQSEEAAMRAQLAAPDIDAEDRLHLHFALGKAHEDRGDYTASFEQYSLGAALRCEEVQYEADRTTEDTARSKTLFSREFFAARSTGGDSSTAPIFIVGLPRSGSTLLEQILSSHSAIEGTIELPDIPRIARTLGRDEDYFGHLAELTPVARTALGEDYMRATRIHRKLDRPFFIDKMPNNCRHVGLIHLILPRAKIIDARRSPMAACFSAFKQHFARGQGFSYDLADLGRYYRDYVDLMDHFDVVMPGRIHRVIYEEMIENVEPQIRRLLDYCGLPFEAACLRFHENERAVRTASSEQVRRPIYREGLDHWRNYEPWLGPLKEALGPALLDWRGRQDGDRAPTIALPAIANE